MVRECTEVRRDKAQECTEGYQDKVPGRKAGDCMRRLLRWWEVRTEDTLRK